MKCFFLDRERQNTNATHDNMSRHINWTAYTTSAYTCPNCDYHVVSKSQQAKNMMKRLHKKKCKYDNIKEEGTTINPIDHTKHLRGGVGVYDAVVINGERFNRGQVATYDKTLIDTAEAMIGTSTPHDDIVTLINALLATAKKAHEDDPHFKSAVRLLLWKQISPEWCDLKDYGYTRDGNAMCRGNLFDKDGKIAGRYSDYKDTERIEYQLDLW